MCGILTAHWFLYFGLAKCSSIQCPLFVVVCKDVFTYLLSKLYLDGWIVKLKRNICLFLAGTARVFMQSVVPNMKSRGWGWGCGGSLWGPPKERQSGKAGGRAKRSWKWRAAACESWQGSRGMFRVPRFGGASIPPSAPYPLIGEMWRAEETKEYPAYKAPPPPPPSPQH